jgi:hypothetical protein
MPIKGSGSGQFAITYAPYRTVTIDATVEASAKFDEGFGISLNKWGNQYGGGFSITTRIFMIAAEVAVIFRDERSKAEKT